MVYFLIFPQNMHCGYSLGLPDIEAVLKSKPNPCVIGAKDCVPKPSTVILMTIKLGPILVSAKQRTKEKNVPSVRFEPGTSTFEILDLANPLIIMTTALDWFPAKKNSIIIIKNCSFFEAGNK